MLIGINSVAAFKQPRTGVEEYTYQLIKHLAGLEESKQHQFILYTGGRQSLDFNLPKNFKIRFLKWSWPMWTQIRLATEMLISQPDVLFIPAHILPLVHPKNSVVVIHGLEYERYPKMYPFWHLRYLRWSTKYALKYARKIIAVSEATKKDLVELYGGRPEKIEVAHHGITQPQISKLKTKNYISKLKIIKPYILFVGRIESKKNVCGLVQAFDLLKEKYKIPHQLVLAGPITHEGQTFLGGSDPHVIVAGYVSEQEKWDLLKNADVFAFPSFYEGFGLPILEAQMAGAPVITSNLSSMPKVAGDGAVLIEPKSVESIADGIYKIISNDSLREDLIKKGRENIKKFSWQKCAEETLGVLVE